MIAPGKNLVLIGMPGSGKSTIGIILAKQTSRDFVDTDVVIQSHEHRSLQDIVDHDGYLVLREVEEKWVLQLDVSETVIATGGSVVYSDRSMRHLSNNGVIIFLDVALDTLKQRITDYDQRGIARRPDQSFEDLFEERSILYRRYAQVTIKSDHLGHEAAGQAIIDALAKL